VLSATEREIAARTPDGGVLQLKGLLQTDAAINQGNSGGALLDITGKLIGINNAMAANAENIGFAIPVNTVQRVFQELLVGSASYAAWLGFRLDEKNGRLTVADVEAFGPAAQAGLRVGDEVVAVGNRPVSSVIDYARALVGAEVGREFPLAVRRGRAELAIKTVPQPPAMGTVARAIGAQVEEVTDRAVLRDASTAFSDGLMRRYTLPVVLRITHIAASGPAADLKLAPGDVILYWQQRNAFGRGRQYIDGVEGLANLLTLARGQELVVGILRDGEVLEGPLSVR
jgi:S1-C subfamily serine protease